MNKYLQKHAFYPAFIYDKPHQDLKLIVVIPCYNEPDLLTALNSLLQCNPVDYAVEVIVIINRPEDAADETEAMAQHTCKHARQWAEAHFSDMLRFYILDVKLPVRHAGVGLARKTGMDEAVRRFEQTGRHDDKLIVCFDADSQCDADYLQKMGRHFADNPKTPACSVYFEHPLHGTLPPSVYSGITRYELYLRYYIEALRYAGHPHAYHAIGSSMAVRSDIYQKEGGMNKRKAGEDFYFLHKIIPLGHFTELNTTRVIPSPRNSDRVPFGTGRAISDWLSEKNITAYDLQVFKDLRVFIQRVPELYTSTFPESVIKTMPQSVQAFLKSHKFYQNLQEIKKHVSGLQNFEKRFFRWFNGFRVLKYVHYARDHYYPNQSVFSQSAALLHVLGYNYEVADEQELLNSYRRIERYGYDGVFLA